MSRPKAPRPHDLVSLSQEIRRTEPHDPFALDPMELLICLREARRGAAAAPSGMTSDHLFPMLESHGDWELFVQVCTLHAVGQRARRDHRSNPSAAIDSVEQTRRRSEGGIVVGGTVRRLVARTVAKQIATKVEDAAAPFR